MHKFAHTMIPTPCLRRPAAVIFRMTRIGRYWRVNSPNGLFGRHHGRFKKQLAGEHRHTRSRGLYCGLSGTHVDGSRHREGSLAGLAVQRGNHPGTCLCHDQTGRKLALVRTKRRLSRKRSIRRALIAGLRRPVVTNILLCQPRIGIARSLTNSAKSTVTSSPATP